MGFHRFPSAHASYSDLADALADALDLLAEKLPADHAELIRLQGVQCGAECALAAEHLMQMEA